MSNASEDGVAPSKVGVAELEVSQQRNEAEIRQLELEKGRFAAAERAALDACAVTAWRPGVPALDQK